MILLGLPAWPWDICYGHHECGGACRTSHGGSSRCSVRGTPCPSMEVSSDKLTFLLHQFLLPSGAE